MGDASEIKSLGHPSTLCIGDASEIKSLGHRPSALRTVVVPALRKKREGRGTLCIGDAGKIKSLATRAGLSLID